MTASVVRLTRYHQKGVPGTELSEVELLEGIGMDGNMIQGGQRQLSLLSVEVRQWMEAQRSPGLCFKRFKENILTEGIPLENLAAGCRLSMGGAVLKISMENKRCHSKCGLFSLGMACLLAQGAVFAVVEQSGFVCAGDQIRVL